MSRSWVEVSLGSIAHNVRTIRSLIPPNTEIIGVVKADGYGHGMGPVAGCLTQCGVNSFGVANLEEATELRALLSEAEILVFGGVEPGEEEEFLHQNLTAAVFDRRPLPSGLKVQLKIDTGMSRIGLPPELLRPLLSELPNPVTGLYSMLSSADCNPEYTHRQIECFLQTTDGLGPIRRHLCNSSGLLFQQAHLDAVRPGLTLYGIAPCPGFPPLRPALRWKSRILTVNRFKKGTPLGYGGSFLTQRPSRIGVVSVGYADGYNRLLSNQGLVRTSAGLAPVVGRVSMDVIMIDLTDTPGVERGHEVTLLEDTPDSPLSATEMARMCDTIPYEILTRIGARVRRVFT